MTTASTLPFTMREPCKRCGCTTANIIPKGSQDTLRCTQCDTFCYNVSRTDSGRAIRTVTTVHNGIKLKVRAAVLQRFGGRCALCGATDNLHVGHALSVDEGVKLGLSDREINHPANLLALCAECNLGIGKQPLQAIVYAQLLRRQVAAANESDSADGAEE